MSLAALPTHELPKSTPMIQQYLSIKKKLSPDTVLFFRLGDFYEMFFEDAERASELLNITLTGRGKEADRVPMCGIPHHSFQGYVKTLIDHNLKVAICEQIGDPKETKGIVERKITRIISPATYLDDESKGKNSELLCSIIGHGDLYAVASLELSTGDFFVREMPQERLFSELTLLQPREVVIPEALAAHVELEKFVRHSLHAAMTTYEDWVFDEDGCLRLLQENFRLASAKAVSFCDKKLSVQACGGILYFLRDHLHQALDHLRMPVLQEAHECLVLDRQTQKSLELVTNLGGQKSAPTLFSTLDRTLTPMGSRMLYRWLTHPLLSLEEIARRQEALREFSQNPSRVQFLRTALKGIRDAERLLGRLSVGVANARDLLVIQAILKRVPEIRELIRKCQASLLQGLVPDLMEQPQLILDISAALVDEPPVGIREGGLIRDGHDSELDEIRSMSRNAKQWLLDFEKKEGERTGIKSLKLKYSGVFGYTIEISKSNQDRVPDDYIRRQTLANAERYITPELKVWDEKISGADEKIRALEYRLFLGLRENVLGQIEALQKLAQALATLDVLCSLSVIAIQKNWVCPQVTTDSVLHVKGGRHPVVEAMLPLGEFVENDTFLDQKTNQLVLLTGPNMAGKSTYIRQIALITILAQMGSFVPAESAKIGLVDRIFTRIGASDNLAEGESTFMVEMVEMAHILQKTGKRSLLILDEVGRGTSTYDGVSIAWAICEFLVRSRHKPRTLFATHYHELTQLEGLFPEIKNYHITVKETQGHIVFLRKVVRGGADRSYGIHVAELAGIPPEVVARAREIMTGLEKENGEISVQFEKKKNTRGSFATSHLQSTLFGGSLVVPEKNPTIEIPHPAVEALKTLNPDALTPLEALRLIYEWKKTVL